MNRITIISILISFLALCSCVEEISHDGQNGEETDYISASFYADIAQTKTGLDGDNVIWNKGDQVKLVIWGTEANYDSDDVESIVSFIFTTRISGTKAYFSGKLSDTEKGGYYINRDYWFENDAIALYPTTVTTEYPSRNDHKYSYNLASSQTPVINSFAPNLALSSANIKRSGIYSSAQPVSFQNACALIRIVVPAIDKLTSIKIESAGDVQSPLTGEISNLSYDAGNGYFTLPANSTAEKSVTLYDGNAIKPGTYNLVVWPGEHSKLKVTMTKSDGSACSKTLSPGSGTISLERSEYTVLDLTNFGSATFTEEVTIELDQTALNLGGDANSLTGKLAATASSGTVSWTSDNTSVATVSDGLVTVVGEGTANITATSDEDNTKSATCVVTVSYRKTPAVGDYVYSDGTWSVGYLSSTATPIGLVCYIGDLSADTELKNLNSSYNVIVVDKSDINSQIYNGNTTSHFYTGYDNGSQHSQVDVYNRIDTSPGDKFFGYSLFYSWKVCALSWGAVMSPYLMGTMTTSDVISGRSTCWYVPAIGEYKAIYAMQNLSGLIKSGYTSISGDYATLYLNDSDGYIYKYSASSNAVNGTGSGTSSHKIRKVFATTLANH